MIHGNDKEYLIPYQKLRVAGIAFLFIVSYFPLQRGYPFLLACYFLMAVGTALNAIVIRANRKRMPVLVYRDKSEMPKSWAELPDEPVWELRGDGAKKVVLHESVRLPYLADRFRFRLFDHAYSIGDFVAFFGIFISFGQLFM